MGIVNAGALAVYDDIDPELRERSRTWSSNRRRTPPSGCSRSPTRYAEARDGAPTEDLAWRERRSTSA
jgi:5-methyltetrahydrofolate--homocysteine methyltransferase